MKIEKGQVVPAFAPVIITIETREELKELVVVLGEATTCTEMYYQLNGILNP